MAHASDSSGSRSSDGFTPHGSVPIVKYPFPSATVTIWCVNTAHPRDVFANDPAPDRGFGRKLLAQLNPQWPVTHMGDFPLNRSTSAGHGEIYIGGFDGVAIIQYVPASFPGYEFDVSHLSALPMKLIESIPASDIYAFAADDHSQLGGFAHWHEGKLERSFCSNRVSIFEDTGLPEPFETPFWAGERSHGAHRGIELPFLPAELAMEALHSWLGLSLTSTSMDVPVAAFAIDGRPASRLPLDRASGSSSRRGHSAFRRHANAGDGTTSPDNPHARPADDGEWIDDDFPADHDSDYDDYAHVPPFSVREWADIDRSDVSAFMKRGAARAGRAALRGGRALASLPHAVGDRVRARARKTGRREPRD
ncbi:hypothetical protein L3H50_04045 [Corynebacterium sp. MC-04]|uniref:Uncharacterized protein n=1 Tax=Corynebacterium parakroppenstedtii TaxID=2828363 RepID=A0ABS9HJK1_9CORY|nr:MULTISPECIES: hypothetical protein [Corynebacterium]MDU3198243.1 hypothetical protein [Corynebacterium kroppenstedtii]MCF6769442.1 hypothetical protein [Corynebacterium parakroppenstedtii]MCF6771916.1 hypothetical protein [Corynebacterium parakroppenstedtii]MCF6774009.1 hypothetical protein [Corynebacterium parakroppenstedtii]MCF6779200.1 hypothetical protein [Corynebacterium parakroppenstedtii]